MTAKKSFRFFARAAAPGVVATAECAFVVLWSSGYVVVKYALPHAGILTMLFFRYLLLSVVLVAMLAWRNGTLRLGSAAQLRRAAVTGTLAHAVWLYSAYLAVDLGVSPGAVALIAALQPMLTGVVAAPILKERGNRLQWAGLFIGFSGTLLVVGDQMGESAAPWWGYAVAFVPPISLTAATVYQRALEIRRSNEGMPIPNNLAAQCVATTAVLAPFAAGAEGMTANWNAEFLLALTWLTFICSLGGYALLMFLIKKSAVTRAASLFYLVPPATMVMDYFAFGNAVTINGMFGLLIAAIGVFLAHCGKMTRKVGKN